MRKHFPPSVHIAEEKGTDHIPVFLLCLLYKIFQSFLLIVNSTICASIASIRYAQTATPCKSYIRAEPEAKRTVPGISHFLRRKRQLIDHTIIRAISNFGLYFPCHKSRFIRLSLTVFYTFTLVVSTSDAVYLANAKPIPFVRVPQNQPYYKPMSPRVLMPPLDLGFRGQTSHQADRDEFLNGYQSDDSAVHVPKANRIDHFPSQMEPPLRMSGSRSESAKAMNLLGGKTNSHDLNSIPPSFHEANYFDIPRNNPFNGPQSPHNLYYPYDERATDYTAFGRYGPNYGYGFPYVPNSRGLSAPSQSRNRLRQSYAPPYIQRSPYPLQNDPRGYVRYSPQSNWRQSSSMRTPQTDTRAIGHESNYRVMSENEIEEHMKNYHEKSRMHLPNLPDLEDTKAKDEKVAPQTRTEENHLVMNGNLAHDYAAQRFVKAAEAYTSAEDLFDEIDTNKDGVIRIEELRNFLWLHEVATAP